MTEHPESDCGDLKKMLELLHKTIGNLTTKLRLEKSIGVDPYTPVKKSTPNHPSNLTEFHTAEQSFDRPNATIRATSPRPANATFDVARQPGKNETFNVSANQRFRTRADETFDVSAPERSRRGTKATFEFSAKQRFGSEESTSERIPPKTNKTVDASAKQRYRPRPEELISLNTTFSCKFF